jgi:hypothetical protein
MSRERVLKVVAEVRRLVEKQQVLFDLSTKDLTAYAVRHDRIGQLSKELERMSFVLSGLTAKGSEIVN